MQSKSSLFKTFILIISIVVSVALVISAIFMLSDYKVEMEDRAASRAQYNTLLVRQKIEDGLDELAVKAHDVASNIPKYTEMNEFKAYINEVKGEAGLYDGKFNQEFDICKIQYYKDGIVYSSYADEISLIDDDPTFKLFENNYDKYCYAGSYFDTDLNQILICFYAPVTGSEICDAIEIIYTHKRLELLLSEEFTSENAEYTLLIDDNATIVVGDDSKSSTLPAEENVKIGNIAEILRLSIGTKVEIDTLNKLLLKGVDGTIKTTIDTSSYIISVGSESEKLKDLHVLELYKVDTLVQSGIDFANSIVAIIILFVIISVGAIIFLIIKNINSKRIIDKSEELNTQLNVYNRLGFEKHATNILSKSINTYYVVGVMEIRHYAYIKDKHGLTIAHSILRYIKAALIKSLYEHEVFGYIGDGQFALLLHAADKDALMDRAKLLSFVLSKYKSNSDVEISLKYGFYEIDKDEKTLVTRMVDYSIEANNSAKTASAENALMQYNFYDVEIKKTRSKNEEMEMHMESALKNGEFQVFFQPKYNFNYNRQDGCEALVRWYDVETGIYNPPALFMALFETNGFITKLDRYVFERVCDYLSYSIAHGRTVYPVSVNVSRITAVQPGFVDFYSKVKKRHGLSDGLIMIEFTESFAYENYETLYQIVEDLHKAGFKCSIDDFGCGYSSYLILKSLPMDEIKLDKIFMDKGFSDERDNTIYKSIVKLGKDLGMKVTQEGVETKELTDYVKSMGCDVLQGYIYSKPLAMSDYIKFAQSSQEHNLYKK